MILKLYGMRTPRTRNSGQGHAGPMAGGLRGSAGGASGFSLEVRQSHRPLEEPINLVRVRVRVRVRVWVRLRLRVRARLLGLA